MSNRIDLTDEISDLFLTAVSIEGPLADFDLIANGVLDSLTFVDILLGVEERFGVEIGVADSDRLEAEARSGTAPRRQEPEEVARSDESLDLHRGPRPAHVSVVRGSSPVVRASV